MQTAPRIGYGLEDSGYSLKDRIWELRDLSAASATRFLVGRAAFGLHEVLRMQINPGRLTVDNRVLHYYCPLDAVRPGRGRTPLHRRIATLLWNCLAERCVELPVAHAFLQEGRWATLLEVGNVLGNWYDLPPHVVVDRYERGRGIINEDIVAFRPGYQFDAIISISTLEHVGFDEPTRDPAKFLLAVRNLERLRKPEGRMLITVPIGYNPSVDLALASGEFSDYHQTAVVGDASGRHGWHQVTISEALLMARACSSPPSALKYLHPIESIP